MVDGVSKVVYKFVLDRNERFDFVSTIMIMKFSKSKGFSAQETGYALQGLKKVGALSYNLRHGWIAKG